MGRLAWAVGVGALMTGGACANGLIADQDAGLDGAVPDVNVVTDAGKSDVIKPGDAGCPSPTKLCGSNCVDLSSDPLHCGTCTTVCTTADAGDPGDAGTITAICTGGTCGIVCDGGLSECTGQCFDTSNDLNHCGSCTNACDGGACCSGTCIDTTSDNANCGACGAACDAGTCISSTCATAYKVGNYTLFSGKSSHASNYLLGSRITLSKAATLVDFGIISVASGPDVTMALYTESGGHPGTLVAYTGSTALSGSDQQIAPNTNASLSATNYWIMAVYNTNASVGIDYSNASVEVDYISFTYGSSLPTTFGTPQTYTGQQFNYYLLVK
jgi:hypothetical protein